MSEIAFQPYLSSICHHYEKWWQLYTLTDAEDKQRQKQLQSPFDFGLIVQTVKKEDGERQNEEKVERLPVLEGLRKYAKHHVLLVGRPGSGKSTTLARLLLEEATAQTSIPVLVELRYWQGSILDLVRRSFARHELALTNEQLEVALSRSLLLFDGVNELPSEEARSQLTAFRRDYPKLPMIFTTRDLSIGGDFGIEKKLEMQPLTEAQLQAFVRSYVPEQADQMLRQLKNRLQEFGKTPLLLWMLCSLFQQSGEIPENLGMVFRLFTQQYQNNVKQDVVIESDHDWWKPVLQQLAWTMMQGEKPTEMRVAIHKEAAERAISQFLSGKIQCPEDFAQKCLRDLQKYHLIQAGANPEELEFRHQLIQEYYAAEVLLKQLPMLENKQLVQQFLNNLKWTEPIALMLALADEAQAVKMVKLGLEIDQRLGAKLAGAVKPELQKKTVEYVRKLEIPIWLKIVLLGETKSEAAISSLLQWLEYSNSDVRKNVVEALNKIGSEVAIPSLLTLLKHIDPDVRRSAVEVLGSIGSEIAIPSLLTLLGDTDPDICWSASEALSAINSATTIPKVLVQMQCTNWRTPEANWSIPEGLGAIDSSEIANLLDRLEHSSSSVRWHAAETLGMIGAEIAIPQLIMLLEDTDSFVRKSAAEALGVIGAETAVPQLIMLLEDTDSFVRKSAAEALGVIGAEIAVPQLIVLLEDTDSFVRKSAAEALGVIGSETAVPGLMTQLEDANADVREHAAEALGMLVAEAATSRLLELLKDTDFDVRRKTVKALGNIAKKFAPEISQCLPYLLNLTSTDSGQDAYRAILAIQESCKYYNYEVYLSSLPPFAQNLNNATAIIKSCLPLTLFYSYSHEDELLCGILNKHLQLLQRQGILDTWNDRQISPGTEWEQEIKNQLQTADIILLLISADFLASDYCYDIELTQALDRHYRRQARVIPIILRPCDWASASFGKLQALPISPGAGAKPVTTWDNQDEAFLAIAQGIRHVAQELRQAKS